MNYFDIGIIVIVLLAMLFGFAKGFGKSLASLFGWLVSIVIATLLAKTVANALLGLPFISKYFFHNPDGFSFANWIYGILPDNLRISMATVRGWIVIDGQVIDGASDILLSNIKDENALLGMFMGIFKGSYLDSLASAEMLSYNVTDLSHGISILLANSLLVLFTGIFILILLKIVTNIIIGITKRNAGFRKNEISFLSRFLGLVIGLVKGLLTCAAIFAILSFAINFPFFESPRKMLLEDQSIIAGKYATTVFEWTDKLLTSDDLSKVMENSGLDKSIDLNNPPKDEPNEENNQENTDGENTDGENTDQESTNVQTTSWKSAGGKCCFISYL